jgi:hypothetical protein
VKGNPQPTADGLVKGQKPASLEGMITLECHVCGYGNGSWPGYFAIPDNPENRRRTNGKGEGTPVMCPSCRNVAVGRMLSTIESIRGMEADVLQRHAMIQEQEIIELRRQLALERARKTVAPEPVEDVKVEEPVKESIPRSGQRK